jgi:hypothetical protein
MSKVSSNFNKALQRKAAAVEEARKAENLMSTCKMPVGWKGQATCVGAKADQGKDKKDEKGQVTEGKLYVALEFQVINDPNFAGSKFNRMWFIWEDSKFTFEDRFGWCLNGMEMLGLPRDLRENYKDFEECLAYFSESDEVFDVEVVKSNYAQDGKEVKVTRGALVVDTSSSMTPEGVVDSKPTASSSSKIEVGSTITYLGKDWTVEEIDGDEITIKSSSSGKSRIISTDDLD